MTKVKEDIRLIDYLKEKGISHEQIKTMIEESIDTALEKEEVDEEIEAEPTQEEKPEPEVPTFTTDDIKVFIEEEVKRNLKIKRKVPSKGRTIKPEDVPTDKDVVKKNWFEVLV